MNLPSPVFLLSAFFQLWRRFPGAMLSAFLGTIASLILVDANGVSNEQFYIRNWMTCQLGLPFLTAIVVFAESKTWSIQRSWGLQALGFAALIGVWYWLDPSAETFEQQTIPQYLALVLILHLAVAFAPFLNTRAVREFWEYNRVLFANLIVGYAFTMILFVGLALAILAIDNLFGLNVQEKIYARLFIGLAGIFNTSYFLYHFPKKIEADTAAYSWVFRNLCKYILIPIVLLYFVILYAYGAKIGLQWSLPKGWISALVLGFSVAGIFTYLLNFYLAEEDESWLVKGFKSWFWWVLLPLTGLLFVAIGTRIQDYGVTEERFLVAELGVWLAAVCLYFLISKQDNIKFIPISLAIFALLWAFGPLNAFAVSKRSQTGILTEILADNGRFEGGKMKPGNNTLTEPELEKLKGSILYLEQRNGIKNLLPVPIDSTLLEYGALLRWLKIEAFSENTARQLMISADDLQTTMEIRGFDLAFRIDLSPAGAEDDARKEGTFFKLNQEGKMLEWWNTKDGKSMLVEMFDLNPAIQKWSKAMTKNETNTYTSLPLAERSLLFSGKRGTLRCILENIELEQINEEKRLTHCSGWILLKEK